MATQNPGRPASKYPSKTRKISVAETNTHVAVWVTYFFTYTAVRTADGTIDALVVRSAFLSRRLSQRFSQRLSATGNDLKLASDDQQLEVCGASNKHRRDFRDDLRGECRRTVNCAKNFAKILAEFFVFVSPPLPRKSSPAGTPPSSLPITIPSRNSTAGLAGTVSTPPRWLWYTRIASDMYKGNDRQPQDTPDSTFSRSIGF
ncbi:hypothetical protein KCU89_g16116, partial [Aureobasidium melanogenum]